jgi:serine/threonine-protein kinase RIO1
LWAEKEFRNLKRMKDRGLPVPTPVKVENNALLMDFIGIGTKAAPSKFLANCED